MSDSALTLTPMPPLFTGEVARRPEGSPFVRQGSYPWEILRALPSE